MLSPTIWEDPSFNTLSYQARIAFIGLISNADDDGYLRGDYKSIKRLVFGFDENDTRDWYEKLKNYKNLHFYTVNDEEYVHLVKWDSYQSQREDRRTPSTYPKCPHCQADDGQMLADDGQLPAKVSKEVSKDKLSKVKLSKSSDVPSQPSPQEFSKDFFKCGPVYESVLLEFATGNNHSFIEKEFKKFVLYWTEPNKGGTKERWELEKTFDVRRRLYNWLSRSSQFNSHAKEKVTRIIT